jgi:hypothetical protein
MQPITTTRVGPPPTQFYRDAQGYALPDRVHFPIAPRYKVPNVRLLTWGEMMTLRGLLGKGNHPIRFNYQDRLCCLHGQPVQIPAEYLEVAQ